MKTERVAFEVEFCVVIIPFLACESATGQTSAKSSFASTSEEMVYFAIVDSGEQGPIFCLMRVCGL